ncbi:2-isopropylmalate synthase [compost metagenome]
MPTASVRVRTAGGEILEEAACGNGSVDSIYRAIDRVTNEEVVLEDYKIVSITHGKDALGEVYVRLSQEDGKRTVQGRGVSTDILEASAKAYLRALNKLIARRSDAVEEVVM